MSTAYAPAMPATPSASPNGGSVGGPSSCPVWWANPLIASINVPNARRSEYGPSCPKPVTRSTTSRGLRCSRTSGPSPHFSSTPGRKFSTSTSASAASSRSSSWPSGVDRLSVTARLLRAITFHHRPCPSRFQPCVRAGSPFGCSTLSTSAPMSPSSIAVIGAA